MCFDTLSIKQCIQDKSLSIFSGKVISIDNAVNIFDFQGNPIRVINIEVDKLYKGSEIYDKIISIYFEHHSNSFTFIKDSIYLIYAHPGSIDDIRLFRTSICERTRLHSKAEYDISILSKHFQPKNITRKVQAPESLIEKEDTLNWLYVLFSISIIVNIILLTRRK